MPELPDISVYIEALERRIVGHPFLGMRLASPFLLRTAAPPPAAAAGRQIERLQRIGKRIAIGLSGELWLVLHLMIAGRLHWRPPDAKLPGRRGLAAFDFPHGTLTLTEAGSTRRASLYVVQGNQSLEALDPGGIEVMSTDLAAFTTALTRENHTLKRALTDPHAFSGIGNAYSDEILHAAGLSPVAMSRKLTAEEIARLYEATRVTLRLWIDRLRVEAAGDFPENVTAFRADMAVHGRFGQPCPSCGAPVQRIRYASNETNYCPRCQTDGRVLADRSLSRLLKADWPRSLDDLEETAPRR